MLEATIKIEFNTDNTQEAMDIIERIIGHIEWSSEFVSDVYLETPPTPETL